MRKAVIISKVWKNRRRYVPILGKLLSLALLLGTVCAGARELPLTILYTTDLHGHILGTSTKKEPRGSGGLLRCATLIAQVRAQEKNVLLLDAGDTFQGSAESWLTGGRCVTRAMELLRYDAWCLGNHDFDWGTAALTNLLAKSKLDVLAANISPSLPNVQPYLIKDMRGVRVAIIGVTNPWIPKWTRPELLGDYQFPSPIETLAKLLPIVRAEKPDVLLLLIHEGYRPAGDDGANEIHAIAKRFPEFDAILGGHQHETIVAPAGLGLLYIEAGCHGGAVGRVDLLVDIDRHKVIRRSAALLIASNAVPESAELRRHLARDLAHAEKYLAEPLGGAAVAIAASGAVRGQAPMQQLLCAAIAEQVSADIVLHGTLSESGLAAGPLSMRDLWRIVPYENRIGVAQLTPQEIRALLEENAATTGDHFLGVWGLAYDLHPNAAPGQRVQNLRLADGTKPHAKKRFTVAMNSHTLASGGGRYPTLPRLLAEPHTRFALTTNDTRAAVAAYIRHHSPLPSSNPPLVNICE
ncbi:MAG: bifunctional UDP-sugar hydrolase/5'-nucleotidase [Kiritimatiellaeota bacterium]|nr:bifunctional UDP-sugar hydrolase/5'-nucleotidase [Kiritimatiellota bacterium]